MPDQAQQVLTQIKKAPVAAPRTRPSPDDFIVDVALELGLETDTGRHDLYVQVGHCSDSFDPTFGGFDDGTRVRQWTPAACRALLVPPLSIYKAGSDTDPPGASGSRSITGS